MKKLTVFTPTYNRAYLLPRLYQSLCNQTNNNFNWLIIDDGSSDNTKELVDRWILENKIQINYYYKKNGGMHTAHNLAYSLIKTELNICIDSDDKLPTNAVEIIYNIWNKQKRDNQIAGIIGLDANFENEILGDCIPNNLQIGTLNDLYNLHKVKGDKKLVLRTDIVKKFNPYPEFENEKLVPLGSLYLQIDQHYKYIYTNHVLCNVEYQIDGSTNSIFNQYLISPKGFGYARKLKLKYFKSLKERFKNCIHLVSSGIHCRSINLIFKDNPYPFTTFVLSPIGALLYIYIIIKTKKS